MGISAILGFILPVLPGLINTAETLITAPKSGATKMNSVLQAIRAFIGGVTATQSPVGGAPPATQPTDDELRAVIETVLAQIKLPGTLNGGSGRTWIVQGGTITELMAKP